MEKDPHAGHVSPNSWNAVTPSKTEGGTSCVPGRPSDPRGRLYGLTTYTCRSKPNPVKDLRNRIDSLMELLSQKSAPLAPEPASASNPIPPGLTEQQSLTTAPQHSLAVEAPTDIADFLAGLITVPPPVAATSSPDCAASSQPRSSVSPVANLGNRPVAYSGDRLKVQYAGF
jgi:hypothetical protein